MLLEPASRTHGPGPQFKPVRRTLQLDPQLESLIRLELATRTRSVGIRAGARARSPTQVASRVPTLQVLLLGGIIRAEPRSTAIEKHTLYNNLYARPIE